MTHYFPCLKYWSATRACPPRRKTSLRSVMPWLPLALSLNEFMLTTALLAQTRTAPDFAKPWPRVGRGYLCRHET